MIFVITRADAIGGSQVHVRDMAMALRDRGAGVKVAVGGEGPYLDRLAEDSVEAVSLRELVRPIHPRADYRAYHELKRLLRAEQPTIVSTHAGKAGWLGRVVCRHLGIPVVFTAHGWAFADGVGPLARRIYLLAEQLAGRYSDRIITVCDGDRELALASRVAGAEVLRTVYNGMPEVDPAMSADPATEPPRLVMVARLEPQKDHPTLFRALAHLRDRPWTLDLVGPGPRDAELRQLAADLGIADRINFLGLRHDVALILQRSHIFLLISNWEGFPRSILEAMRAGLPVIATDVAGVRESVVDAGTGYTIARGDVSQLAHRLALLLDSPQLRAQLGSAGQQRFRDRFTASRMFAATMAVYDEVLSLHGRAPRFVELAAAGAGFSVAAPHDAEAARSRPAAQLPVA